MIRQMRFVVPVAALVVALAWMNAAVRGQVKAKTGEWDTYGADLKSTRYSPLDQINKDNFKNLEVAWRFKTDFLGPRPEFNFQSTPLMVDGIVYSTAGTRRAVVALDAATGELIWMHRENEGPRGAAAPRTWRAGRRRARSTRRGSSAATTSGRASACGSSTRFRSPASSATTRGKKTRGPIPATPASGRR